MRAVDEKQDIKLLWPYITDIRYDLIMNYVIKCVGMGCAWP